MPSVTTFFVKLSRPEEMKGQHQAEATQMPQPIVGAGSSLPEAVEFFQYLWCEYKLYKVY